jgi:hypothetical protein
MPVRQSQRVISPRLWPGGSTSSKSFLGLSPKKLLPTRGLVKAEVTPVRQHTKKGRPIPPLDKSQGSPGPITTAVSTSQKRKTIPFIKGHLLTGSVSEFTKDRLGLLQRMAQQGDVVGMYFGPFPGMLFNRPEHVHSILVEHAYDFDKGLGIHKVFRSAIGDGIFSSEGDFHRHQRKLMAPSFQPRHIAGYAEHMGYYGEQIQQTWADEHYRQGAL